MKDKIKCIAFDADDTLWENELYFQEFENEFCKLLSPYLPTSSASEELFKTEMKNLHMYGYGLKSMMLSMIETACFAMSSPCLVNRSTRLRINSIYY